MVTARMLIDETTCKKESALYLVRWKFARFCETSNVEPTLRKARRFFSLYPENRVFLEKAEKEGYLQ